MAPIPAGVIQKNHFNAVRRVNQRRITVERDGKSPVKVAGKPTQNALNKEHDMFNRTRTVLSALALSLVVAGPLTAQNKPVAPDNATVTTSAPGATVGVIQHEQLQTVLENLGYELHASEGDRWSRFALERGAWKIQIQVAVTPERVYVMSYLTARERMKDMPLEFYQRLLSYNAVIHPHSFLFNSGDLYMAHSIPNQGVNPAALRKLIDGLAVKCVESGDYWVPTRAMRQIEEARINESSDKSAANVDKAKEGTQAKK